MPAWGEGELVPQLPRGAALQAWMSCMPGKSPPLVTCPGTELAFPVKSSFTAQCPPETPTSALLSSHPSHFLPLTLMTSDYPINPGAELLSRAYPVWHDVGLWCGVTPDPMGVPRCPHLHGSGRQQGDGASRAAAELVAMGAGAKQTLPRGLRSGGASLRCFFLERIPRITPPPQKPVGQGRLVPPRWYF